jgi:hypothetical protein
MSFLLTMPYALMKLPDDQKLIFNVSGILMSSHDEVVNIYRSTIPLISLVLITGIFSFCIIFFYGRRVLQIRLTLINLILIVILSAFTIYYCLNAKSAFEGECLLIRIPIAFPIVCILFCIMAMRAIWHDEMLVNSYKRMR